MKKNLQLQHPLKGKFLKAGFYSSGFKKSKPWKHYWALISFCFFLATSASAQTDFFGRSLTGQSPNSANSYLLIGVANETNLVNDATNLTEFEHATRQIELFNLGIEYTTQVLGIDSIQPISIDLDTVVGGALVKNSFRFALGLQYEMGDRQANTSALIGASRFQAGGFSVGLRHEMSVLPEDRVFQIIPATATDQSLFATIFAGLEGGFDSGFSLSLDESGVLDLVTDHLVRDVAEGNLTFEEYQTIENQLHESIRYQAPRNAGGSEWYFLALAKVEMYSQPFAYVPLRFSISLEGGFDVTRLKRRNQNRFGLHLGIRYLLY